MPSRKAPGMGHHACTGGTVTGRDGAAQCRLMANMALLPVAASNVTHSQSTLAWTVMGGQMAGCLTRQEMHHATDRNVE